MTFLFSLQFFDKELIYVSNNAFLPALFNGLLPNLKSAAYVGTLVPQFTPVTCFQTVPPVYKRTSFIGIIVGESV